MAFTLWDKIVHFFFFLPYIKSSTVLLYHGIAEEVRGSEDFKKWVGEDLSVFSDMRITILDEIEEQNKVAIRWNLKTTHEKDFAGMAASHKKIEIEGTEILHFEKDKIKEGWTIFNMAELAIQVTDSAHYFHVIIVE